MSDVPESESASIGDSGAAIDGLPENLPPVQPPSAGFIIQLFVVPLLIVLAIAGVVALFGKMASSGQDWRKLVIELRTGNEHRRGRAAHGLAVMLQADQARGADGSQLARNPEIAEALTDLLKAGMQQQSPKREELNHQAFLLTTLGWIDSPATVIPVLREAMQPGRDTEIRKNAIRAISLIAGRHLERGEPLDESGLDDDLIAATSDDDALIRQLATYALGLVPGEDSKQRLEVLTGSSDPHTRVNAAIGLARQKSTAGIPVFEKILEDAVLPFNPETHDGMQDVVLKNSIKAVGELSETWSDGERKGLLALLEPIAEDHRLAAIRSAAITARLKLRDRSE